MLYLLNEVEDKHQKDTAFTVKHQDCTYSDSNQKLAFDEQQQSWGVWVDTQHCNVSVEAGIDTDYENILHQFHQLDTKQRKSGHQNAGLSFADIMTLALLSKMVHFSDRISNRFFVTFRGFLPFALWFLFLFLNLIPGFPQPFAIGQNPPLLPLNQSFEYLAQLQTLLLPRFSLEDQSICLSQTFFFPKTNY